MQDVVSVDKPESGWRQGLEVSFDLFFNLAFELAFENGGVILGFTIGIISGTRRLRGVVRLAAVLMAVNWREG